MNTIASEARRRFLLSLPALASTTGLVSSSSAFASASACPCETSSEDKAGGAVSISLHSPKGGHYTPAVNVTLKAVKRGTTKTLCRPGRSALYTERLEDDLYDLNVDAPGFETFTRRFEVCGDVVLLPVYLRPKGWPAFHLGPSFIPFPPVFDTIAIVFSAPFWRDEKAFSVYLAELASYGLMPLSKEGYILAQGEVILLRTIDATKSIFVTDPAKPPSDSTEKLFARLREFFYKSGHGRIRIGVPVSIEKHQAKVLDNRFIVRFKPGEGIERAAALADKLKATVTPVRYFPGFWLVVLPFESNYLANLETINSLVTAGDLCSGEADLLFELRNSGCVAAQEAWYKCEDFIARQHIDDVWNSSVGCGSPAITIATIDEGVNPALHTDINKASLQCFDLLYVVDPTNGATSLACNGTIWNFHGMQVYGVISARHDTIGVSGIAPDSGHIAIRRNAVQTAQSYGSMLKWVTGVDNAIPLDNLGNEIEAAKEPANAINPYADIVNCSHGMYYPSPNIVLQAFEDLTLRGRGGQGCVIVYAADEAGIPDQDVQGLNFAALSRYPIIVSNSATDQPSTWDRDGIPPGNEVYDLSAHVGWRVDICAYGGTYVHGATPVRSFGAPTLWQTGSTESGILCRGQAANGISPLGETSAAAAMVSGVAALVLSAAKMSGVTLNWRQVKAILLGTAEKIDADCSISNLGFWRKRTGAGWFPDVPLSGTRGLNYHSHWYGFGRLDADAAVQAAKTNNIPAGSIYAPF